MSSIKKSGEHTLWIKVVSKNAYFEKIPKGFWVGPIKSSRPITQDPFIKPMKDHRTMGLMGLKIGSIPLQLEPLVTASTPTVSYNQCSSLISSHFKHGGVGHVNYLQWRGSHARI